jgi:hypothetical protein
MYKFYTKRFFPCTLMKKVYFIESIRIPHSILLVHLSDFTLDMKVQVCYNGKYFGHNSASSRPVCRQKKTAPSTASR